MTTDFLVDPRLLIATADALNEGTTSLDVPALNSCDISMFSELAGGAAAVAEPSAGRGANKVLAAYGNSGMRMARDIVASAKAYATTEAAATAATGQIIDALGQ